MNYLHVIEKRTASVDVQVYSEKDYIFAFDGKIAVKRLYDNMGCDSGMEFYCSYNKTSLSIKTNLVLATLTSMERGCENIDCVKFSSQFRF